MAIALDTLRQSEHFKLKKTYGRYFAIGMVFAIIAHILAAIFSPPYSPAPYQLRERTVQVIQLPDEIIVPPPPQDIARPELPQDVEVSEEASEDVTMAPTDFNPFAPPVIPDASGSGSGREAEIFVAYDTPPQVVHQEAPVYPDLARQAEAEGTVNVLVTIDETGRVVQATVASSDVIQSLEQAAIEAAYKWLFRPAKQRDVPVKVRIVIPFRFSLN